ncbi:MAG: 30S ribosomal protein S6 [Deltaproteobacteria bacterium]|nr:30S ribosomal protein S6 [Deltaproteobacteria bacterium]
MAQGYELLTIFNPEIAEEEIQNHINKLKDVVSESEGEFFKADTWGPRKLMYKIKKHSKGYYLLSYFSGTSKTLQALDALLRYNERILRYQTIKLDKKIDIQSLCEEKSPEEEAPEETTPPQSNSGRNNPGRYGIVRVCRGE